MVEISVLILVISDKIWEISDLTQVNLETITITITLIAALIFNHLILLLKNSLLFSISVNQKEFAIQDLHSIQVLMYQAVHLVLVSCIKHINLLVLIMTLMFVKSHSKEVLSTILAPHLSVINWGQIHPITILGKVHLHLEAYNLLMDLQDLDHLTTSAAHKIHGVAVVNLHQVVKKFMLTTTNGNSTKNGLPPKETQILF